MSPEREAPVPRRNAVAVPDRQVAQGGLEGGRPSTTAERPTPAGLSGVYRRLDPTYPTNRAIILLAAAAGTALSAYRLLSGSSWLQGGVDGAVAGFATFFAWALCRELDPDHEMSAFVSAAGAMVAAMLLDHPDLLALVWLLTTMRVVGRPVGVPATILDVVSVMGLGTWLSLRGDWGYGAVTAAALFLDGHLPAPPRRRTALAAAQTALVLVVATARGASHPQGRIGPAILAVLAISVSFVPVMVASRRLASLADATGEPLSPHRVQAGQLTALVAGLQEAARNGVPGAVSLFPLWAAVAGAACFRLLGRRS